MDAGRWRRAGCAALVAVPWVTSMYGLYWFEQAEIWAPETLHRDKVSLFVLTGGMFASYGLYSWLFVTRGE